MPLPNIFRRFSSKKETRDLETLKTAITQVERKVRKVAGIRVGISSKINQACEALQANPSNEGARRTLVINLERERRFLDIIRKGIKNGISILEVTLKELGGARKRLEKQVKKEPRLAVAEINQIVIEMQTIQFLIDSMQFAKGKIKVIEKRIKNGESLEKRDYAGQHLNQFLQTLREEEEIDRELALVLEGKSKKVRSNLNILKYMNPLKDGWMAVGGLGGAALGAGIAYGGTPYYHNVMGVSSPADSIPTLAALIISISLGVMLILAHSTFSFEEGRRKGKGKVGDFIKIPK